MKILDRKFWKVGTNPFVYFNNFLDQLSQYEIGTIFVLSDETLFIKKWDIRKKFGKRTTLRQNIIAWEAFGFIYEISKNNFMKILDNNLNDDLLFRHSFISLLKISLKNEVDRYRDSILWKLIQHFNVDIDITQKFYLKKTRGTVSRKDLEEEFGKYEKEVIAKFKYIEIFLKTIEEENF